MLSVTELRGMLGSGGQAATGAGTFSAVVTRVDADGTTWCQVDGSSTPTPCATDMACSVGDVVTVRIADHRATVTGNATSPATDDSAANAAQASAEVAQGTAKAAGSDASVARRAASAAARQASAANAAASEASALASATNQHFWQDSDGASVTEQPQDEYAQQPTGWRKLLKSTGELLTHAVNGAERIFRSDTASGTLFYDGECTPDASDLEDHVLAAFTSGEVQVGASVYPHMKLTPSGFQLYDRGDVPYVSLNGTETDASLKETHAHFFVEDASKTEYGLPSYCASVIAVRKQITSTTFEDLEYTLSGNRIIVLAEPLAYGTVFHVDYYTSELVREYSIGVRSSSGVVGQGSVVIADGGTASGYRSVALAGATAGGWCSVGESRGVAEGEYSHAEGLQTNAIGAYSHAEGMGDGDWLPANEAKGTASHVEGFGNTATGFASHAEGQGNCARGDGSHAEGGAYLPNWSGIQVGPAGTEANGDGSHAEGVGTIASSFAQHVEGSYNIEDANNVYAHIVGNGWVVGDSSTKRSNCYALKWDGTQEVNGSTDLPIFKYATLPAESSLPLKPCIVVLTTGEVYLAT
ncbi:hypothetical protein [Denitrobacterium detoxificans]|uniref:Uncharacterized protein n=1 Tax=Denitrobacterium detoxificans TaxID=79604 RepID=A0A1H8U357_9ACTN|nr:hypothetical protein [Denitrobacterium detoxificans]SEO97517.1 hypothetical protein SAMN02910314_01784 [Denitrobacterium detoxificans]